MLQQQFVRCQKCGNVFIVFPRYYGVSPLCCDEMMVRAGRIREPLGSSYHLASGRVARYDAPLFPANVLVDDILLSTVTRKDTWLYENFAREDLVVERFDDRERRLHVETTAPYNQGLF